MGKQTGWQSVHDEALRRIQQRIWAPGALIPNEEDLAAELGCARATVNRALRELADAGLLERRRKAGTRVTETPERRARFSIPLIRDEIESRGATATYALIARTIAPMPDAQRHILGLTSPEKSLHVQALHLSNGAPFVYENRWVNLAAVPALEQADLTTISANEWLLRHAPLDRGTFDYAASAADPATAGHLGCAPNTAIMTLERTTHSPTAPITWVRLSYAPGYRLHMDI
jgi:GntR family histidine utilization transcriptional repressor